MNNDTRILLLMLLLVIFIVVTGITLDVLSCSSKAAVMQKEYHYGIMSGCMIKTEKGFFPLSKNITFIEE